MGKKKRRSNIVKGRNPRNIARDKESGKLKSIEAPSVSSGNGVRGLNNLGNTCFFNSALQGLNAAIDQLHIDDDTHPGHMHRSLIKTLSSMREHTSSAHNPIVLHQAVCDKFKQFKGRRQQDAHELLLALLSRIHDEQQTTKKDDDTPYRCISDLLQGTLASIIQCCACSKRSVSMCNFIDISIPLPGSEKLLLPKQLYVPRTTRSSRKEKPAPEENIYEKLEMIASSSESSESEDVADDTDKDASLPLQETMPSETETTSSVPECNLIEPPPFDCDTDSPHVLLEYCLSEYVKPETLQVSMGNGYMCPHCSNNSTMRDALKRLLLLEPPQILLLHMKRLLPGGKYSLFVQFPLVLDMEPFAAKQPDKSYTYKYHLYSVVVHQGTATGGHYVAYVKRLSQWYYVSDSQVRKCSEDEALRASAYMLMYRHACYDKSDVDVGEVTGALGDITIDDSGSESESDKEHE